jgi:hypothetical protein
MGAQTPIRALYRSAAWVALAVLPLPLVSCNKSKSSDTASTANQTHSTQATPGPGKTWGLQVMNQPGTLVHVEYSDKTFIVDRATVARALRGVTEDHRIFLFEDSPELRQKLVPGKFVLFEGLDLRKVDALAVDGKNLVVGTETAPLREALKNAQLQWSVPVDFDDLFNQLAAEPNPSEAPPYGTSLGDSLSRWWNLPTVYAGFTNREIEGEVEITDSDFATWKVHYHYTRNPDRSMELDVQLHREAKGLNAGIRIKSHLTKFTQVSSILMSDGEFRHAYYKNVGLHGTVDLSWEVSTSENKTPMNEVRFKLPGKISIPLVEETGLPMSLQISEALLFHPAFTTKGEVAKGGFHVDYSGDEGFKLDGSDMEPDGEAQGESTIDQTVAFSPLAAYGLVVAMAVPRVELRMGTEELFEMGEIPIPQPLAESLGGLLLHSSIAGQWLDKKVGNPLSAEAAAYFQVVISTTAAASGMQSLVPCQQFTMVAKGQVGVDAMWLGTNTNTPAKDIFTKNLVQRKPDAKICGGG